ncbi:Ssl1-like-domain-containing protein [Phakopsora pachyrhizi]|uniref:General transcription and DNA repair factor IIH n=1 Tax=Phakopsora pachyrhizi TaxID=170000 RepID=A0AAV0BYU3_PHAPC|nr:Ssl1-like-domain-containing protein [Phakopsora pachyrhizi]CAH7690767.1 Ssl1-like-domain-containing protein [Phakopsora pachyrhizi]
MVTIDKGSKHRNRTEDPNFDPQRDGNRSNNIKPKKKKTAYASQDGVGYSWEEEYKRSWDVLKEDDSGSLETAINQLISSKRNRIMRDNSSIQRGIIRHLCIILDLSLSMTDRDLRPNRLSLTINYTKEFVTEFFDQNPISQLCILVTRDGISQRLSHLSGNPIDHHRALDDKSKLVPSGEPSLQNALEMARATLSHLPSHGSHEALMIMGSLTTCDPRDINETIKNLESDRMRVSIVGLAAEVHICKEICKRTQGKYGVILNEDHFKELLFESIPPPPKLLSQNDRSGFTHQSADLIQMGFPKQVESKRVMALCVCHPASGSTPSSLDHQRKFRAGFICPRCEVKNCENPTNCLICGLMIVSSPHLARTYRHLFPVANWKEITIPNEKFPGSMKCFGCDLVLVEEEDDDDENQNCKETEEARKAVMRAYHCERCGETFCMDCDVYHDQLGLCPGCC